MSLVQEGGDGTTYTALADGMSATPPTHDVVSSSDWAVLMMC